MLEKTSGCCLGQTPGLKLIKLPRLLSRSQRTETSYLQCSPLQREKYFYFYLVIQLVLLPHTVTTASHHSSAHLWKASVSVFYIFFSINWRQWLDVSVGFSRMSKPILLNSHKACWSDNKHICSREHRGYK